MLNILDLWALWHFTWSSLLNKVPWTVKENHCTVDENVVCGHVSDRAVHTLDFLKPFGPQSVYLQDNVMAPPASITKVLFHRHRVQVQTGLPAVQNLSQWKCAVCHKTENQTQLEWPIISLRRLGCQSADRLGLCLPLFACQFLIITKQWGHIFWPPCLLFQNCGQRWT